MWFELTPPRRMVPPAGALDHSTIQWHIRCAQQRSVKTPYADNPIWICSALTMDVPVAKLGKMFDQKFGFRGSIPSKDKLLSSFSRWYYNVSSLRLVFHEQSSNSRRQKLKTVNVVAFELAQEEKKGAHMKPKIYACRGSNSGPPACEAGVITN